MTTFLIILFVVIGPIFLGSFIASWFHHKTCDTNHKYHFLPGVNCGYGSFGDER